MGVYLVFSFTKRPYSRMTIWSDYFSLSTVYILIKDNMIDAQRIMNRNYLDLYLVHL